MIDATSSTHGFRIESTCAGAMSILSPHGELDLAGVETLLSHVDRLLQDGPLVIAVDLRGLTFMDASGVHALITAGRRCEAHGRRFTVVRGANQIDRLLKVCGLDGYFDMVSELDQLPDGELMAAAGL
ncbi:MAG TPA: STAS domain-containing protein [Solirubrobacteraceae bacterium]|nr:STAS domain-containing protein [Solirubrobacteraceae bacterium]